jgi:hypothetical protein
MIRNGYESLVDGDLTKLALGDERASCGVDLQRLLRNYQPSEELRLERPDSSASTRMSAAA